jgi:hypothetical protein
LARFDRHSTEARDLPALLSAAEEFRASIEREVRTILEAAEARATEIERRADFNATQREQVAEHRSKQIVESVFNRASRVLDSIDLVESALSGMLGALRDELQSLAPNAQEEAVGDVLEGASDSEKSLQDESARQREEELPPGPQPEPAPESVQEEPAAEPPPEHVDDVQEPPAPLSGAEERDREEPAAGEEQPPVKPPEQAPEAELPAQEEHVPLTPEAQAGTPESTSEFDRMVRQHLMKMLASGRPRAEAERFLERFHFGGDYAVTLDEIYGEAENEPPPQRRGFIARLRRRAR